MNFISIFKRIWPYSQEELVEEDPEEVARRKVKLGKAIDIAKEGVQPFSEVVQELSDVLLNPDYVVSHAVELLESDPTLAARVLAIANSAAFVSTRPCDRISQAFPRLGARTVYELTIAAEIHRMFGGGTDATQGIIRHCSRTATTLRVLGKRGRFNQDRMFLAGLMHDIGKILLEQSGEMVYPMDGHQGMRETAHLKEFTKLGYDHADLGSIAIQIWGIPDPVSRVVAWHHKPSLAFERGGDVGKMVALLRIAEFMEERVESTATMDHDLAVAWCVDPAFQQLKITPRELKGLWEFGFQEYLVEALWGING